jgi:hypothetical protein
VENNDESTLRTWPLFTQGRTFNALVDLLNTCNNIHIMPIERLVSSDVIHVSDITFDTEGLCNDIEISTFYNEPVTLNKNDFPIKYGNTTYYISYVMCGNARCKVVRI